MKKVIEFDKICQSCDGTGIYVGLAERDGAGVVCYSCKGSGCVSVHIEYEPFLKRSPRDDVKHVYEVNPGICIGTGKGQYKLSDFGGIPLMDWASGKQFGLQTENRLFTCPAWWYQSADYKKKPNWDTCLGIGAFSGCDNYHKKSECWKRFDNENA